MNNRVSQRSFFILLSACVRACDYVLVLRDPHRLRGEGGAREVEWRSAYARKRGRRFHCENGAPDNRTASWLWNTVVSLVNFKDGFTGQRSGVPAAHGVRERGRFTDGRTTRLSFGGITVTSAGNNGDRKGVTYPPRIDYSVLFVICIMSDNWANFYFATIRYQGQRYNVVCKYNVVCIIRSALIL